VAMKSGWMRMAAVREEEKSDAEIL
jgi:hypothetical protein